MVSTKSCSRRSGLVQAGQVVAADRRRAVGTEIGAKSAPSVLFESDGKPTLVVAEFAFGGVPAPAASGTAAATKGTSRRPRRRSR